MMMFSCFFIFIFPSFILKEGRVGEFLLLGGKVAFHLVAEPSRSVVSS